MTMLDPSKLQQMGNFGELKRKILFTIGLLAVYRLGVFVSTPGIDVAAVQRQFSTEGGTLFGLINMFSGGAFENFSIFTLGIAPYISVSIIMQVLTPVIPALEALKKEGESGRRVLTRYTRWGTILLALIQSYVVARGLESQGLVYNPGLSFEISTVITLTAGTAFIMWLGEQITEKGIGNGTSLIIMSGIIAGMPGVLLGTVEMARVGEISPLSVILLFLGIVATVGFICFVERSFRKIPIQYPRRNVGKTVAQAQTQYLPLKVNLAGVIPPIFASALIVLPVTFASFSTNESIQNITLYLRHGTWTYSLIFAALIILFSFFYTAIIFNPEEVAENLKKNGGFVPSIRPGKPTVDYLYGVLNKLTVWGALYITAICIIPELIYSNLGVPQFAFVFGGTAILIVVGVTLDLASQIETYFVSRNYQAFLDRAQRGKVGGGPLGMGKTKVLRR